MNGYTDVFINWLTDLFGMYFICVFIVYFIWLHRFLLTHAAGAV